MATEQAILKVILEVRGALKQLSDLTREWIQSANRMDRAADGVDFDLAQRETRQLEAAVKDMAASVLANLGRIESAAAEVGDGFRKSRAGVSRTEDAIQKLAQDADRQLSKIERAAERIKLQRIRTEATKLQDSFDKMSKEVDKDLRRVQKAADRIQLKEAREAAKRVEQDIRNLERTAAKGFQSMENHARATGVGLRTGIGGNLTRLDANVDALRQRFVAATNRMRTAANQVEFNKAAAEARRLGDQIAASGKRAEVALDRVRRSSRSAGDGLSTMVDVGRRLHGVLLSLGVALGARQIIEFAKSAVEASIRLESFEAQMRASANTVEDANTLFAFANDQAERLGLSYPVLAEATARFSAATKNTNLSLDQQREVLLAVFESARVLNLSNQRLSNTLLALEQIASKSTVSMEELRRQLGDNIPGAVAILAKQMDVSQEKLLRMIETNQVLSEDALPLLAKGLRETFGAGVQDAINTTAASIGRLQKQIFDFKVAFAGGFAEELRGSVGDASSGLEELESRAGLAGKAVGVALTGLNQKLSGTKIFLDEVFVRGWVLWRDEIPKYVANVALAVDDSTTSLEALDAALSEAADTTELADLELASLSVLKAFNELSTNSDTTSAHLDSLRRIVEALVARFSDIRDVPDFIREVASKLGIALPAVQTAAEKVEEAIKNTREEASELRDEFLSGRKAARDLAQELLTLTSTGVDGLSLSIHDLTEEELEDLRSKVEEVIRVLGDEAPAGINELARELEALGYGLLGTREELEGLTTEVRQLLEELSFGEGGALDIELLSDEQLELLKSKIQEALDAWGLYGQQVPEDIAAVADQLEVTTSIVEKELEEQEEAAKKAAEEEKKAAEERIKALKSIGDAFLELSNTLNQGSGSDNVEELQQRLRELQDQEFNFQGSGEELQKLQAEIESTREQLREAASAQREFGDATEQTADQVDDALRSVVDSIGPIFSQLDQDQRRVVQGILQNLQDVGQAGAASSATVERSLQNLIFALDRAGQPTGELTSALEEMRTGAFDLDGSLQNLVDSFDDGSGSAGGYKKELEDIRKEMGGLVEELDESKSKLSELRALYVSEARIIGEQLVYILGLWKQINQECEKHKDCLTG